MDSLTRTERGIPRRIDYDEQAELVRDYLVRPMNHVRDPNNIPYLMMITGPYLRPSIWQGIKFHPRLIRGLAQKLLKYGFFERSPMRPVLHFFAEPHHILGLEKPLTEFMYAHAPSKEVADRVLETLAKEFGGMKKGVFYTAADYESVASKKARMKVYRTIVSAMKRESSVWKMNLPEGTSKMTLTKYVHTTLGSTIGKIAFAQNILNLVGIGMQVAGWVYMAYSLGKLGASLISYANRKVFYNFEKAFKLEFGEDVSDFFTGIPLSERQRAQRAFAQARMGINQETYLGNEAARLYY